MKPQTGAFLEKSRRLHDQADAVLGIGLNEAAGRTSYMAGLHAAQIADYETGPEFYIGAKTARSVDCFAALIALDKVG